MGDLGVVNPNGAVSNLGFKFSSPDPSSFLVECFSAADVAVDHVVNCIRPTLDSEERRRDVIEYLQRLVKNHLNCEVFPYGSVPLKTYLPDGDIDLTVLKGPNTDESLASHLFAVLQGEQQNQNAEFELKDTQLINAEVKIVKCIVKNIVIDISFNQLGGLSTLCFLEQVDRIFGRNHLFKRSIILIKSWCYYESRILGASHWLLSTYALETLILYIFHLFHQSLSGPLSVLYKFLDYYSQFDWENYGISLKGPVLISSLPDIVVNMPESGWNDVMLTKEFMENCTEMFSVSSKELEDKNPVPFQPKHLNIIDPLRENNNLGRSVSKGNFYRIRSAFKFGARKLSQILSQPSHKVAQEISEFYENTLARHGNHSTFCNIPRLTLEFHDQELLSSGASFSSSEDEIELEDNSCETGLEIDSKGDISSEKSHENEPNFSKNLDLDSKGIDLSSVKGESDAINPLADFTGDYDSQIRSLLHGQLCKRCLLSTTPRVCEPMPYRQNRQLSDTMNSQTLFTEQNMHQLAEGRSKVRGTGTYIPHMNGFYTVRPFQGRGRNNERGANHNNSNRYRRDNSFHPNFGNSNSFNNGAREILPRSQVRGISEKWSKPEFTIGDGKNKTNDDNSKVPCRVEFGSIGNLAEELMSGSDTGQTAETREKSFVGSPIHIKNDDEFPPLGQ